MKRFLFSLAMLASGLTAMSQTLTELAVPKYFGGRTAASVNNGRVYVIACVQFDGLQANSSYDLKAGIARVAEVSSNYGGGSNWDGSSFSTSVWLNAFTTDVNGSSGPVWIAVQPTGNNNQGRFAPDTMHNIRIGYALNGTSMPPAPSFVTTKSMKCIEVSTTPLTSSTTDDAAVLVGTANSSNAGKYVLVYDDTSGTGDPVSINRIRSHSFVQFGQRELPELADSIMKPGISLPGGSPVPDGSFATIIPAGLGILRVESRNEDFTLYAHNTDLDGVWPSGANTTNTVRKDLVVLTNSDAPLAGAVSANTTVEFLSASTLTTTEGAGQVAISLVIKNKGAGTVQAGITAKPNATAIENQHFMYPNGTFVTFDQNSPDTLDLIIGIIDDNMSGPRFRTNRFGLTIQGADPGTNDSLSISIQENDYEYRKIAGVKQLNANGVTISNDSVFEVTGVVIGYNTRTTGYSFTMMDETGGISTFAPASASTFGYTITEGDSILVRGRLTQFNGLAQLDFLDTIIRLKQNAVVPAPEVVPTLTENDENRLVRINNVRLINPVPTWNVSGSGFNFRAYTTTNNDTFDIRVLGVSPLANTPAPTGEFDIIGIGSQFDASSPFTAGYQLLPRYIVDVVQDTLGEFDLLTPTNNTTVQLAGDGNQTVAIYWSSAEVKLGSNPVTYSFLLDLPTGNFSSPILALPSANSGADTFLVLTYKAIADAFGVNLTPGNSLTLKWTVLAACGTETERAASEFVITFERDTLTGMIEVKNLVQVYPNPATDRLFVNFFAPAENVRIIAMNGQVVKAIETIHTPTEISLSGLNSGVYFLQFSTDGKQYSQKFVIQNR